MQQSRQAFGNPAVFLERLITNARHVEVQVFGDGRGTVVTLGDRDCSAQRRRQKVFEEAPAPGLSPATRAALADAARALLEPEALPLRGHGRIRARRRHRGVPLPRGQHPAPGRAHRHRGDHRDRSRGVDGARRRRRRRVPPGPAGRGHAPDGPRRSKPASTPRTPRRDFLPSPGLVTEASWPAGTRVDTWVRAGTEVTPFYDPLLAKVVVHAPTRAAAVDAMRRRARRAPPSRGIETNLRPPARRSSTAARSAPRPSPPRRSSEHDYPRRRVDVLVPGQHHRAGPPGARSASGTWASRRAGPMDDRSFRLGNRIARQPGRRARARVHRVTGRRCASPPPPPICLTGAAMRGDVRRRAGRVLRPGPRRREPDPRVRRPLRPRPAHVPARARRVRRPVRASGQRVHVHPRRLRRPRRPRRCAPATSCTSGPTTMSRRDIVEPVTPAIDPGLRPPLTTEWELAVVDGPHAAPDFVTDGGHGRVLCHRLAGAPPLVAHRRAAGRAAGRVGTRPTAAKPGSTRRTCTTRRTPSARWTSPATCRSCSGPTARASAASRARSP